jgi:L-lactate dehydrogenase (cytochrome)
MPVITGIEDLRTLARKRVPRMFYDYADAGSWSESTYRANEIDFSGLKFRQRVVVNTSSVTTAAHMLSEPVTMPVALAPTGLTGMLWPDGEILAARAAERFGVPYTLSTMSICSIEDVAANSNKPFWFQLYLMRDRDFVARLIERARAAGCPTLVLTLDLQTPAQRNKDLRNGLSLSASRPSLGNLLHFATRPAWCMRMLRNRRVSFRNIVGHAAGVEDVADFWAWTAKQFEPDLSWNDVAWVRRRWSGKLVLKGIMDVDDAHHAVNSGADAVIVSNHGGRQLDGAPSSISALSRVVDAVGGKVDVHLDGGIRSGQDVLRALALGAKGVYIGRPFLYGLGAMGEKGVELCLQLLHKELEATMKLCGIPNIAAVNRKNLHTIPSGWLG